MVLSTERLILRPWKETDAGSLYEYAKNPEVGPAAGWPPHKNIEESRDIIQNVLNGKECYAVCLKSDNRAVGAIELKLNGNTDMTDKEDECELGYWIGQEFWGQGLIPEAVLRLQRRGFEDLKLAKIWCGYFDGNEKSKRVQEKCGFTYHHTNKDIYWALMDEIRTEHITCLTKEDWERSQER